MRAPVPSWRVGDAVTYDDAVTAAARAVATGDVPDEPSPLARALRTRGFNRSAVDALKGTLPAPVQVDAGGKPFDPRAKLETKVIPLLFGGTQRSVSPLLVLLGGGAGSGRARAIAQLVADREEGVAVVSPDILRTFIPDDVSGTDGPSTDEIVGAWLGACLRHAREHGISLLVDAPFRSPDVTVGLIDSFRREGFETRVAVVAVSRAESLMAVTSQHLHHDARHSLDVGAMALSMQETREVLAAVDAPERAVRVVVLDRNGAVASDRPGDSDKRDAVAAHDRAASSPMSTLQAAQWLSELRRATEFVLDPAVRSSYVAPAVVALHDVALQEVVPRLAVPAGSKAAKLLENRIVSEQALLRRAIGLDRQPRPIGPEVIPTGPTTGPSI